MKLKLNIPERPRLMAFMPTLDILALVFAFPLLVSHFSSTGGHKVVMPTTTTRIPSVDHAIVIELLPGDQPQVWINQEKINFNKLESTLEKMGAEWFYGGDPVALLKIDKDLTAGEVAQVRNLLAKLNFDVWVVEKLEK